MGRAILYRYVFYVPFVAVHVFYRSQAFCLSYVGSPLTLHLRLFPSLRIFPWKVFPTAPRPRCAKVSTPLTHTPFYLFTVFFANEWEDVRGTISINIANFS